MANQRKRSFESAVERGEGSKLLSAILIGIGFLALLAIMWMTGRFGWSLQEDQAGRYASAAALISAASYMLSRPGAAWKWRPVGAAAACISIPPAVEETAMAGASPPPSAAVAPVTSAYQLAGTPDSSAIGSLPPHSRQMAAGNDNAGPALAVGTDSGEFTVAVPTANPMAGGATMAVATDSDVASETATDNCWRDSIADQVAATAADTATTSAEWAAAADWFVAGGGTLALGAGTCTPSRLSPQDSRRLR